MMNTAGAEESARYSTRVAASALAPDSSNWAPNPTPNVYPPPKKKETKKTKTNNNNRLEHGKRN